MGLGQELLCGDSGLSCIDTGHPAPGPVVRCGVPGGRLRLLKGGAPRPGRRRPVPVGERPVEVGAARVSDFQGDHVDLQALTEQSASLRHAEREKRLVRRDTEFGRELTIEMAAGAPDFSCDSVDRELGKRPLMNDLQRPADLPTQAEAVATCRMRTGGAHARVSIRRSRSGAAAYWSVCRNGRRRRRSCHLRSCMASSPLPEIGW
jgi:hypothetical protein